MLLAGSADDETTSASGRWAAKAKSSRSSFPAFEREHPGIRVQVQQIPWTAAHEKLLTAFVGEATPDIAMLGNTWVPEFVALDALEPLDARVAASKDVDASDFFPGIWNTNVVDGSDLRHSVVRRHARASSIGPICSPRPATTACRRRGPSGGTRWSGSSRSMGPRSVSAAHPDHRVAAAGDLRAAGGLAAAPRRRALRRVQRAAFREGVRLLRRAFPRRPRPGVERHRDLEPLPGVRARKHRDVHQRPVADRRVHEPPADRRCRTSG